MRQTGSTQSEDIRDRTNRSVRLQMQAGRTAREKKRRGETEGLRRGDGREPVSRLIGSGLPMSNVITVEPRPDAFPWVNPRKILEPMNPPGRPLPPAAPARRHGLLPAGHGHEPQEALLQGDVRRAGRGRAPEKPCRLLGGIHVDRLRDGAAGGKIKTYLSDIREIGATTANSFLLAILREWQTGRLSDTDTEKLLRVLRTYLLRRRLIGETGQENKMFPALTSEIPAIVGSADRERRRFSFLAAREHSGRLPNDTEIEWHFETMNFNSFRLNKFVLRLIEEDITKSRPKDDKKLQLEHIMPQKLSDGWREEIGQDYERVHQELLHNIGNITLIRFNQELSNRSFGEKKGVYDGREGLQVSRKWITDREHWDEAAIRRRQKEIVRYLLENVLPVPDRMRTAGNYAAARRTSGAPFSFRAVGLIGKSVVFIKNPEYTAKVVGDREVEFEGRRTKLSPLTRELFERMGRANSSGAYQGAQYWSYGGVKLARLMEQANGDAGTDGEQDV